MLIIRIWNLYIYNIDLVDDLFNGASGIIIGVGRDKKEQIKQEIEVSDHQDYNQDGWRMKKYRYLKIYLIMT